MGSVLRRRSEPRCLLMGCVLRCTWVNVKRTMVLPQLLKTTVFRCSHGRRKLKTHQPAADVKTFLTVHVRVKEWLGHQRRGESYEHWNRRFHLGADIDCDYIQSDVRNLERI